MSATENNPSPFTPTHPDHPEPNLETETWQLDREAIAAAVEFLGLEDRVDVKRTHQRLKRSMGHWSRDLELNEAGTGSVWIHKIKVSKGLTAYAASRTIWHELAHAAQDEYERRSLDLSTRLSLNRERARTDYWERDDEVDARAHEVLAQGLPLVKTRKLKRHKSGRMV